MERVIIVGKRSLVVLEILQTPRTMGLTQIEFVRDLKTGVEAVGKAIIGQDQGS
jgi:hypothetical protein